MEKYSELATLEKTTRAVILTSSSAVNRMRTKSADNPEAYKARRREAARVAVMARRVVERCLFQELRVALPVQPVVAESLDKLSLLRVAACYFKLRAMLSSFGATGAYVEPFDSHAEKLLSGSLLLVLTTAGEIVYVSGAVSTSFGAEKYDILGSNIYDHIQPTDHPELDRLLGVTNTLQSALPGMPGTNPSIFKTSRASATLLTCAGAAHSITISGKVFLTETGSFFVGIGEPSTTTALMAQEGPLDFRFPFKSVMVWDWVYTESFGEEVRCSPEGWLGYTAEDLQGHRDFDVVHAEDLGVMTNGFRVFNKTGQARFDRYRALAKGGGWAWFVSHMSTVVVQERKQGPDGSGQIEPVTYFVGRDYMISEIQEPQAVLAAIQLGKQPPESPTMLEGKDDEMDDLMKLIEEELDWETINLHGTFKDSWNLEFGLERT